MKNANSSSPVTAAQNVLQNVLRKQPSENSMGIIIT